MAAFHCSVVIITGMYHKREDYKNSTQKPTRNADEFVGNV